MRDLLGMMARSGFERVEHVAWTGFITSRFTCGATFRARKPVRTGPRPGGRPASTSA